jgi:hypothetical protein
VTRESDRAGSVSLAIIAELVLAEDAPLPRDEVLRRVLVRACGSAPNPPGARALRDYAGTMLGVMLERGALRETPEGVRLGPEGWILAASACVHESERLAKRLL